MDVGGRGGLAGAVFRSTCMWKAWGLWVWSRTPWKAKSHAGWLNGLEKLYKLYFVANSTSRQYLILMVWFGKSKGGLPP